MRLRLVLMTVFLLLVAACGVTPAAVPTASPTNPPPATDVVPTPTTVPAATPTLPPSTAPQFDGERAMEHALAQCAIGPRPAGTPALLTARDTIVATLEAAGWQVILPVGQYEGVEIHNILAIRGEGVPRMVGAHYDTRPAADRDPERPEAWIIGGNDGASGVAVLLELARVLETPPGRQHQLAFFDAEDRGNLDGWPFSVGATLLAADYPAPEPEAVVVVDMVGDADLQIYRERNSDAALNDRLFGIAAALGYEGQGFFNAPKYSIVDDHLPFLEQGIPAVDLIDFDYPYWHTTGDTCERISAASLEMVGRVVEQWLEEE